MSVSARSGKHKIPRRLTAFLRLMTMNLRARKGEERVSLSFGDEPRTSHVLEVGAGDVLDVASDASDVGVVERGIDLVENEEGRGVVATRVER
jgi:hypothetical protein